MKLAAVACAALLLSFAGQSSADTPAPPKTAVSEERVVARARELLDRARFLDENAAAEEKTAQDLVQRLPNLRVAAKAARDRASRARDTDPDHEALLARAEDLEVEVAVSEAEVSVKKRVASDDRRVARDLRAKAIRLLRDGVLEEEVSSSAWCDPPYRYGPDGRKIYRAECFR